MPVDFLFASTNSRTAFIGTCNLRRAMLDFFVITKGVLSAAGIRTLVVLGAMWLVDIYLMLLKIFLGEGFSVLTTRMRASPFCLCHNRRF